MFLFDTDEKGTVMVATDNEENADLINKILDPRLKAKVFLKYCKQLGCVLATKHYGDIWF